ncbi:hypothetical protein TNCV_983211 [Trichonephila clavipes]|nr:hypothetical protein TNCV_983211 [Trichonephila clavipes]
MYHRSDILRRTQHKDTELQLVTFLHDDDKQTKEIDYTRFRSSDWIEWTLQKPSSMPCSPAHWPAAHPIALKNTSSMTIPQHSFQLADYQIRD